MKVHISDHFTYKNIFKICFFPIVMMVFTSLYSIIDGIFIANFTEGTSAFAAVNLVFPIVMIVGCIGFMMGTGGTALVAKLLGEKENEKANRAFSLVVYFTIGIGAIFSIVGFFLIPTLVNAMASLSENSTQEMINDAIIYGRVLMVSQIPSMLQFAFQTFFMVAEKNRIGFRFTIAAGVTNMVLDALLIGVAKMGVLGAGIATSIGYCVGGFGPVIYFFIKKDGLIHLGKTNFDIKIIGKSAYNGMSEFVSNVSASVVSIIYNAQLLKAFGENGVSAYGIIMYVAFVFISIFIGIALGMCPCVGYNYGAKNKEEMRNILNKTLIVISAVAVFQALFAFLMARPLSSIFSNGNQELEDLSEYAMKVYSLAFLGSGFSMFITSFFTALNNGTVSANLAFTRTIVLQISFAFLFPLIFGSSYSLWWAITIAEIFAMMVGFIALFFKRKKYGYW